MKILLISIFSVAFHIFSNVAVAENVEIEFTQDDSYSIDEGGTVIADAAGGVLANDVDVDGDALQVIVVSEPMNGILQVNSDLSFSYMHDGSETTSDAFTYMAYDNEYTSNVGTVICSFSCYSRLYYEGADFLLLLD